MKKEYQSQDFYLCAYLMSSGVRLKSYHKENQSTVFVFDWDENLDQTITQYYNMQAQVNPVTYGQSIKNLKSIIHSNTHLNANQTITHDPQWNSKP